MYRTSEKERFCDGILKMVKNLTEVADALGPAYDTYMANGWNTTGDDPIEDEDVVSRNVTADELLAVLLVLNKLQDFFNNVAVPAENRMTALNKVRHSGV